MNINFNDKNTVRLMIALACVTLVALISGLFYLNSSSSISVIDFTNKNIEEVKSWVSENELEEQVKFSYQYDEEVEEDVIINQSIPKDEALTKDSILTFNVSKGSDPELLVQLPDFTNMAKDDLINFFTTNKFSDVTYEYTIDETILANTFIKLNIDSSEARRSDMIIVTISVGKENVGIEITMPDFKESSTDNIKAWANTNNITVTFEYQSSDSIASGTIISQSVNAGESILTGSALNIVVSSGTGIEIPNLKGKTQAEVETWAKENNVKIDLINYYADSTEKDKVISTTPSSGTLSDSSTLRVYISLGSVKMIDLVGKKESDVVNWLANVNKSIYDKNNYITYEIVKDDKSTATVGTITKTSYIKDASIKLASKITVTVAATPSVQVDSKYNVTIGVLTSYLQELGMKIGSATKTVYHDSVPNGYVVSNDSGLKTAGTTINYTVSKGAFVPGTYSSLSACQAAINTAHSEGASGYSCAYTESYHDTVVSGTAISQTISGKTINLVLSKGPEPKPVNVVSYAGKAESELISFLSTNGLAKGTRTTEYSDSIAAGLIISNDAGSYFKGSTVNYVVSQGPKPVVTYSIIDLATKVTLNNANQTQSDITSYLKGLGVPDSQIQISVVADSGQTQGSLIEYPSYGTYQSDYVFVIKIAG